MEDSMINVLVRGLPERYHRKIEKIASRENWSVNQTLIRLITQALEQFESEREKDRQRHEAFRRVEEIRKEIYEKYGSFDDSTKLIREDRDSR